MSFTNAQIEGIIAASIVGAILVGAVSSGFMGLREKNVNMGETFRTVGRSIMGDKPDHNSLKVQGSSSISEVSTKASSLFSNNDGKGEGTKRNKKKNKRKTRGRK